MRERRQRAETKLLLGAPDLLRNSPANKEGDEEGKSHLQERGERGQQEAAKRKDQGRRRDPAGSTPEGRFTADPVMR